MAKKAKPSVDKIVKKVNKEFERTSSQIEGLINDAMKQFDHLQSQVQEPVRKLLKDMDDLREREMKRFNDEFERRMSEFQELQSSLLDKVGIAAKDAGKQARKEADKTAGQADAAGKSVAEKKTTTKKTPKAADKSDLTRIKGIGPATAKKMKEAGILSIEQIANPNEDDKKKLESFKSIKGFKDLSAEAKKVL